MISTHSRQDFIQPSASRGIDHTAQPSFDSLQYPTDLRHILLDPVTWQPQQGQAIASSSKNCRSSSNPSKEDIAPSLLSDTSSTSSTSTNVDPNVNVALQFPLAYFLLPNHVGLDNIGHSHETLWQRRFRASMTDLLIK